MSHPADGMTARIDIGDGAVLTMIDPRSFANGGPEWVMRYGEPVSIRYAVAELLSDYNYLLCDDITTKEAIRRLRILRAKWRELNSDANDV